MNARAGLVFSSCAICLLAPACAPPAREDGGGSGPRVMFIEVAPNIKLEVLEWSTGGEPLILLAGAGHTAHVFEHFAPYLMDEFRVLGITRRRHGASTVPEDDFGIDEFGRDIVVVIDQFGIESANFAGHSFGGAELTYLALNFPHRVRKLVYIDGSWDFSRVYYADGWRNPWPSFPMEPADSASPQSVARYFAHTWGPLAPLSEIRARHQFDDRGKLVALSPTVTGIFQHMIGPTLDTIDLSRISTPVLAIRAIPEAVDDMFLDYDSFDSDNKIVAEETFRRWRRVIGYEGQRFVDGVVGARDFRVLGAHHEVHLTEPERILPVIREFLAN